MHLTPGEDQEQLRAAVRSFLERRCDEPEVRRLMVTPQGFDAGVWKQSTDQLGLSGLDVPEALGGSGASFRELAIVGEELGRTLACLPWLSSAVLAAGALLHSDDEQAQADLLPGIADGSTRAALALAVDSTVTAAQVGGAWQLDGSVLFVVDGAAADLLLVAAATSAGPSLFVVPEKGVRREPLETLDGTRKQARLTLSGAEGRLVGTEGAATEVLAKVQDRAVVALACENLGVAARTLEMAVAYTKGRVQFGRSIGSFQAVKHRLADMAGQVETARSAVGWAVACAAEGSPDLPLAASMAGVCCSEAAIFNSAENVQLHGGIGFTWEHPAHLYFRRARSNAVLLPDPAAHRGQLLERLGV